MSRLTHLTHRSMYDCAVGATEDRPARSSAGSPLRLILGFVFELWQRYLNINNISIAVGALHSDPSVTRTAAGY